MKEWNLGIMGIAINVLFFPRFIIHEIVKSQKDPLSLDGRGLG